MNVHMRSIRSSVTRLVFVIHGVGSTRVGSLKSIVETILGPLNESTSIVEINWDSIVDQSLVLGELRFSTVRKLLLAISSTNRLPRAQKNSSQRDLAKSFILFGSNVVEFILFCILILCFLVWPLAYLSSWLSSFDNNLFLEYYNWIPNAIFIFSIILLNTTALIILLSIFISMARGRFGIFHLCVQIILLVYFRVFLSVLLYLFVVPYDVALELLDTNFPTILSYLTPFCIFVASIYFTSAFGDKFHDYSIYLLLLGIWLLPIVTYIALSIIIYIKNSIIGPSTKILLDIFRYIGENEYRDKIQEFVDKEVARHINGDEEIVILAHSLGTIISIDSLSNSKVWIEERKNISLITMGSPLRRWFLRFFPRLFFTDSADSIFYAIAIRVSGFRWLNVSRPWDQVGSAISLSSTESTRDISTDQSGRFLSAHLNYFSDPIVKDKIINHLPQLSFSKIKSSSIISQDSEIYFERKRGWRVLSIAVISVVIVSVTIFLFLGLRGFIGKGIHYEKVEENIAEEIKKYGKEVNVKIAYWEVTHLRKSGQDFILEKLSDDFLATSDIMEISPVLLSVASRHNSAYFNKESLISHIKKSSIPHKILNGRKERQVLKSKSEIKIKYYYKYKDKFVAMRFPSNRTEYSFVSENLFYIFWTFVFFAGLFSAIAAIIYYWAIYTFDF
jgi:hypothetical protein